MTRSRSARQSGTPATYQRSQSPWPVLSSESDLDQAECLIDPSRTPTWELLERARRRREELFGNRVHLCRILNAKSGACSEDCSFCSQSRRHHSKVPVYPLVTLEQAVKAAQEADACGARCFGLVTSGRSINGKKERQTLLRIVAEIRARTRLEVGTSLGLMDIDFLRELKRAGLNTLHHNLETAPGFYPNVCTTHPIELRFATIRRARQSGLRVCSGGIFGLGESFRQRAELALTLREIGPDRVPVNFLNPLAGTPLAGRKRLAPLEALHTLAALRLLLPDQEILVCGGREVTLRSLQPLLFLAGANGVMTGNYLTTPGQGVERDLSMLEDLGLLPTRKADWQQVS